MGPLVSALIQLAILAVVVMLAVAAGWGLARLYGKKTSPAVITALVATVALATGLWLFVRDAFERIETDAVGVATVVTAVVGALWLTGLATGYALARRRAG